MAGDYIPFADEAFNTFQHTFYDVLSNSAPATLGVLPAELAALQAASAAWETALDSWRGAQDAAASAKIAKDQMRAALEALLRALTRRLQANPAMTDSLRASLHLTIADTTPTAAPVPDTAPMLKVDTSERFKHTIAFFSVTPDGKGSRAKPKGAKSCAIFRKIGAPPTVVNGAPTDMDFLALDTATPYVIEYGTADAGKTVYYMARWMGGPHGDQPGPWSETVEATVVG